MCAGPVGVAAAAAIASSKKKRRNLAFETNPSIRKRQATRLTRKLKVIGGGVGGGGGVVVGEGYRIGQNQSLIVAQDYIP